MIDENDEEFSMAMILGQDRLGTADYVAPEQSINSYRIDYRADIYGLGCTLYFGLSGRPPFPADTNAEKIRCHREKKPQPIRIVRPETPLEVAELLENMMAKRPEDRLYSAREIADRLERFSGRARIEFDFARVVKARARWAKRRELQRLQRRRDESVTRAQSTIDVEPKNALTDQTPFSGGSNGSPPAGNGKSDEQPGKAAEGQRESKL
jgi:serine/threonine-protein kinase